MAKKPKIVISLPLVWSFRNYFLSGIIDELSQKYQIYFAVDNSNISVLFNYGIPKERVIELKSEQKFNIIFEILRFAFLKKHPKLFYISKLLNDLKSNSSLTFKHKLKKLLLSNSAFVFKNKILFNLIEKLWFYLSYACLDRNIKNKLKEINPIYILTTTFVVDTELPLSFFAFVNKTPIYTHVLSFDNITSRGYLPISKFNKYFVWNDQMKDELMYYYNIDKNIINITGTPQFDFHRSREYLLDRDEGLKLLSLNSSDRFILYCANHFHISPGEPDLLEDIITILNQDESLKIFKIIVRLHPLDNYDRWNYLKHKFSDKIQLSIPWSQPDKNIPTLGIVTENDMLRFVNQLKHAEVVLNIASTVSIDAAVTNTPVICIGFHSRNLRESKCYFDFHNSIHYTPIMDIGGIPLARDLKELQIFVRDIIENPTKYYDNLSKVYDFFIGNKCSSSKNILLKYLLS